ncbi:unnamed protein product [Amoebophrya sp. A120]|nr:unnamed protein product [Amoebophrya sp. A120]|eukprot:GSA120T00003861001.1
MAPVVSKIVAACTVASVSGVHVKSQTNAVGAHDYIVNNLKFSTTLRVCNAYPFAKSTQVFDQSLDYKTCGEIQTNLQQGQQIDFFAEEKKVLLGSFEVQDTPREDSTLLLVLQPLDAESTGVRFQSHAFANSAEAQVALLDAFVGSKAKKSDLIDIRDSYGVQPRDEKLRLNSVVGLNTGYYQVQSTTSGSNKHDGAKKSLHALEGEKISIIRVGVAGNKDLPEDLIVFPDSNQSIFSGLVNWVSGWI